MDKTTTLEKFNELEKKEAARLSIAKQEWQRHPFTSEFLKILQELRNKHLDACENLSMSAAQTDRDTVINKLNCAKQLKEIINYVKK